MKKAHKMLPIDGEKLRAILKSKDINSAQVCRDIGYSEHYLLGRCDAGKIRPFIADYLETNYDISPDEYVIPDVPKSAPPFTETIPDLTAVPAEQDEDYTFKIASGELEELIARAVCKGIQLYDKSESKL